MRSLACGNCSHLVFFENSVCLNCSSALGYLAPPLSGGVEAVAAGEVMPFLTRDRDDEPLVHVGADGVRYVTCVNLDVCSCNWLVPEDDEEGLCVSCRLTRTRPADTDADGLVEWNKAEIAKRRLLYQLYSLGLPVVSREQDTEQGLAFDLLSSANEDVITGHADGVVTIDLAEGDDPHREAVRVAMGETYRTMLGHMRHEIGHYFFDVLVTRVGGSDDFRALFGDERADYGEALQHHYDNDPPADWEERYVSTYATAHPWEDWAETFAHYLHIRDTLQSAAGFGVVVTGPKVAKPPDVDAPLFAVPKDTDAAPAPTDFTPLLGTWLPLTYALNAVNRSMGLDDLYPFVLSPTVMEKLQFVHSAVLKSAEPPEVVKAEPATA